MAVVWMTAILLVAIRAPDIGRWNIKDVFAWIGLSAVAAILEQFTVKVPHKSEVENYSLTDALWVPVLIFARSSVLALAVLTGVTIGQMARRWAWYKVAYNVGQFVISVIVAAMVFDLFDLAPGLSLKVWLAATVAMLVYFTLNELFIAFIISLVEEEPLRKVLVLPDGLNMLHAAGNLTIGLLAALVWSSGPVGIPLLIAPMVLVFLAYRGWLHAKRAEEQDKERERMQALYEAGRELSGPLDAGYDFKPFLTLIRKMVEASAVELVMTDGDVRVFNSEVGSVLDFPTEDPSLPATHYVSTRPGMVTFLAPIGDADRPSGVLAVHRPTVLSEAESSLVEALASQIETRRENERLFKETVDQRSHLSDVIGNTSDGIFVVSSDRALLSWNPAMERITGISRSGAVNRPCDEVLMLRRGGEDTVPGAPAPLRLERAEPQDALLTRPDGSERWIRYTSSPMPAHKGERTAFVIVARDVTTELETEQLKSDFVATVSHELRSPLTPLKGFIAALRDNLVDDSPETRSEYYAIMWRSVERLEHLIGDLLDVSRVEAGKLALESRAFELGKLVDACVQQAHRELGARPVEILRPDPALFVVADPFRMEQVVMNLLSNAFKYSTPDSRIEIRISRMGTSATVDVHNEGDGIAVADQPHVFDRFYRTGTGLTREAGGVGLGLFICKRLVEVMGGEIALHSSPGRGCTFSFTVPLAASQRGAVSEPASVPARS
jgi:PAS domain S-box-containing protein